MVADREDSSGSGVWWWWRRRLVRCRFGRPKMRTFLSSRRPDAAFIAAIWFCTCFDLVTQRQCHGVRGQTTAQRTGRRNHCLWCALTDVPCTYLFLFFMPNVLSSIFLAAACARALSSLPDFGAIELLSDVRAAQPQDRLSCSHQTAVVHGTKHHRHAQRTVHNM